MSSGRFLNATSGLNVMNNEQWQVRHHSVTFVHGGTPLVTTSPGCGDTFVVIPPSHAANIVATAFMFVGWSSLKMAAVVKKCSAAVVRRLARHGEAHRWSPPPQVGTVACRARGQRSSTQARTSPVALHVLPLHHVNIPFVNRMVFQSPPLRPPILGRLGSREVGIAQAPSFVTLTLAPATTPTMLNVGY